MGEGLQLILGEAVEGLTAVSAEVIIRVEGLIGRDDGDYGAVAALDLVVDRLAGGGIV